LNNKQDGRFLLLSLGRKVVPLSYVELENSVCLISDSIRSVWASSILRSGEARVRIGEKKAMMNVTLVTSGEEKQRISNMFRTKYGTDNFGKWFSSPGKFLRLSGTAGTGSSTASYETWLQEEFDAIAPDYDTHIMGNTINRLLRNRSVSLMARTFPPASRLLEIGCGTGTETLSLLEMGYNIVATDISPEMISVLQKKSSKFEYGERLSLQVLKASSVSELLSKYGDSSFDGIYSTYGALNCEPDLSLLVPAFGSLLKRKGKLVLGVYNSICPMDSLGSIIRGSLKGAFARFMDPIPIEHSRFCIDVWAYSPMQISNLFREKFRVISVEGAPVIIPPSDKVRFMDKFLRHFNTIDRIDRFLGSRWPFSYLGDHFLMVMEAI
jgi:SAM-dependent methyltransferase